MQTSMRLINSTYCPFYDHTVFSLARYVRNVWNTGSCGLFYNKYVGGELALYFILDCTKSMVKDKIAVYSFENNILEHFKRKEGAAAM